MGLDGGEEKTAYDAITAQASTARIPTYLSPDLLRCVIMHLFSSGLLSLKRVASTIIRLITANFVSVNNRIFFKYLAGRWLGCCRASIYLQIIVLRAINGPS